METNKISAIATVIAIVSCKMKNEGLYELDKDGNQYKIKPEFIIDLFEKLGLSAQFGNITNEEIKQVTHMTFIHSSKFTTNDKTGDFISLDGVRCSETYIDKIFNTVQIEPKHHLMKMKPVCIELNPNISNL